MCCCYRSLPDDALTFLTSLPPPKTDFVNPIDAASLAMIFPIVYRSLRGRSGAHKKRAAQITADMTHMVSTPTDLIPYLSRLSPQLELLLTDGSPEVRLTSGKK